MTSPVKPDDNFFDPQDQSGDNGVIYDNMDNNPFHYIPIDPSDNKGIIDDLMDGVKDNGFEYPEWNNYKIPSDNDMTDATYRFDLGLAELMVKMVGDRIVFDTSSKSWYTWRGHYWAEDTNGDVERFMFRLLPRIYDIRYWAVLSQLDKAKGNKEPTEADVKVMEALEAVAKKFKFISATMSIYKTSRRS